MSTRLPGLFFVLVAVLPAAASDEVEALLLQKFNVRRQVEAERLRVFVADTVAKAKELKDVNPDQGIDLLRAAVNLIDDVKSLNGTERRALFDLMQPVVQELRDMSLSKRREKASRRLEAFRDYLEVAAFEGRYPARSGSDKWEPANFISPEGQSRVGKLIGIGTGAVIFKFAQKEENVSPLALPLIQVFGGVYVFDRQNAHHVFLTNREFYDSVWSHLVHNYQLDDSTSKPNLTTTELTRVADKARLRATIETGEFFLRALPGVEPIPGVGDNEGAFLEFVAQTLMHKGLPVPINRIYTRELQDRLVGFSPMQLSAARRTLFLLQSKDASVSPVYAEIMRDETTKLLKSEYSGFSESEANRAILYLFGKLK